MQYDASGSGNFLSSPVQYAGTVTAGEPLLLGGYWTLWIDDSAWPPDSDPAARWGHINATYYAPNYDMFGGFWTATFDENSTPSAPQWTSGKAGIGEMTGTATLQTTIQDFNFNGTIEPDERGFMICSGTLIVVKNGSGVFAGYCGLGSFSGAIQNYDPWNYADDLFDLTTILDVEDCSVPVEEVTWGAVKTIYSR